MRKLTFKNSDAAEAEVSINIDTDDEKLSKVSEWYHAYYHGDRIRVQVDGVEQAVDMDGAFSNRSGEC